MEFEDLLATYSHVISSAVRRVCRDRHLLLAEDVEQEVRIALWRRLQNGKKMRLPRSYIYKVALTTGLGIVQRAERQQAIMLEQLSLAQASEPDVATGIEKEQQIAAVLEILTPKQKDAVQAYLSGLNHREIGKLFDWTPSVARHHLYRGIETIKASLVADPSAENCDVS